MVEACGDDAEIRGDLRIRKQELPLNTISISSLSLTHTVYTLYLTIHTSTHSHTSHTTPQYAKATIPGTLSEAVPHRIRTKLQDLTEPITLWQEMRQTNSGDTAVRGM